MRINSLRALMKIRKANTEMARIALSEAIDAETAANARVAAADRRIMDEAEAAASLGADDGAVEIYARWLPQGRRSLSQARAVLERASQDVAVARTALVMARAAEHAVGVEVERAELEIARLQAKCEQS